MGFSIGSLIGAIAPIVGGLFGGPVGAALGGAVSAAFLPTPQPSFPGPTVQARLPGLTRLPGLIGGAALMGIGAIAEILSRSRNSTGRPVSSQKIRDAARHCGIPLAAQMFGISETDVCTVVISTGRRRARGISAADLRRTRSTLRKVHNIQHDLRALAPPARRVAHHHHRRN